MREYRRFEYRFAYETPFGRPYSLFLCEHRIWYRLPGRRLPLGDHSYSRFELWVSGNARMNDWGAIHTCRYCLISADLRTVQALAVYPRDPGNDRCRDQAHFGHGACVRVRIYDWCTGQVDDYDGKCVPIAPVSAQPLVGASSLICLCMYTCVFGGP
jgi:hypothetical protein